MIDEPKFGKYNMLGINERGWREGGGDGFGRQQITPKNGKINHNTLYHTLIFAMQNTHILPPTWLFNTNIFTNL